MLLLKQITQLTGGNCQKKTPFEMLLLSVGGLNVLCSVKNYSQLQDLFPLLLLECAKTLQKVVL